MKKAKGTFWTRALILLLAVFFGVLVYWSVGYLLNDIRVFKRPDREAFYEQHLNHALRQQLEVLEMQMKELEHKHTLLDQQRGFIKDASSTLQITVDNLFKLRDRNQDLITQEQFARLLGTLDKVIEIQKDFKTTADTYIEVTSAKFNLQKEIAALHRRIELQEKEVQRRYSELVRKHEIKMAVARMLFLIPLAVICTIALIRKRSSVYRLIYASTAVAVYTKTAQVIHEHFPSRYFKYLLISCLLILIGWGFCWLVRRLVKPKLDALLKQYRQAYERYLCPVCEYPIRTGPRRYLYWTRRTVHKIQLNSFVQSSEHPDEPYVCPFCSTQLFEKCESCGNIRHSLLTGCYHCGAAKTISGDIF
ncbi:MAG: hypothetical protein AB7T27_00510 [Kiritimatiellia bacterium]